MDGQTRTIYTQQDSWQMRCSKPAFICSPKTAFPLSRTRFGLKIPSALTRAEPDGHDRGRDPAGCHCPTVGKACDLAAPQYLDRTVLLRRSAAPDGQITFIQGSESISLPRMKLFSYTYQLDPETELTQPRSSLPVSSVWSLHASAAALRTAKSSKRSKSRP